MTSTLYKLIVETLEMASEDGVIQTNPAESADFIIARFRAERIPAEDLIEEWVDSAPAREAWLNDQ